MGILVLDNGISVETGNGHQLEMAASTPKFTRNVKLIEVAKKHQKPLVVELGENSIQRVFLSQQAVVNKIDNDQNGDSYVSFNTIAAIYKVGRNKHELLEKLSESRREQKTVLLGIDHNRIVFVH